MNFQIQTHNYSRLLTSKWGPTGQIHQELMGLLCGPGATLAVFLALYKYRKIWGWIHGIYFITIFIIATIITIPIWLHTGFISYDTTIQTKRSILGLRIHYVIGVIILIEMIITILGGLAIKTQFLDGQRSKIILLTRQLHRYLGYFSIAMMKVNIYVITWNGDFFGFFVFDLISLLVFLYRKQSFPKMESKDFSLQENSSSKSIRSIKELNQDKNYAIISNFVYDLAPLKHNHPAGNEVINYIKNQQVDRYIYGAYTVNETPELPLWSHSFKSFTLLGQPIAKIDIQSTFEGFERQQVECQIVGSQRISQRGDIYVVNLVKKQGKPFKFIRLSNINQLGRYFSLTCNQKFTRLYTVLNFLVEQNLQFLSKYLRFPHFKYQENIDAFQSFQDFQPKNQTNRKPSPKKIMKKTDIANLQQIEMMQINGNSASKYSIPIMFKVYPGGKLTSLLLSDQLKKLQISSPKGQGLKLGQIEPGKIIIIAGGSGIFPFSDLIDLLFKQQLLRMNPSTVHEILRLNPILSGDPLSCYQFQLLGAFNQVSDIHHVTFQQLLFLAERGRIKMTLKFKQQMKSSQGDNISFTDQNFTELLGSLLKENSKISKIWICGPPKMNQNLSQYLRFNKIEPHLFDFI